ncbi:hypothetical protein FGADI_2633 [Fusarium gaditjirri]|uniref:Uncharacterized protein n=1 Tax=Fusarium gaditjirri TaxID=282569 RepID=A0A8H4THK7_9HYPO|nr:hypothetical protein FGADI_2633 [Fusarium gaditjirri]
MSNILRDIQCDACHRLVADREASMYRIWCHNFPSGYWESARIEWSKRWGWGWYPDGTVRQFPGVTFIHSDCFLGIFSTPDPPQDEIDYLGRALTWRNLKHMRLFPKELDIPGPLRVSQAVISAAARIASFPFLGQLPREVLDMVQFYRPSAYFWNIVQILDHKKRLRYRPYTVTTLIKKGLSSIKSWKRGEAEPDSGEILQHPGFLYITLDSDGISEIQRFQNRPHPPNQDPSIKFKRYIFAYEEDVETVDAYFQDGLCCLQAHSRATHPGFATWDHSSGSWQGTHP